MATHERPPPRTPHGVVVSYIPEVGDHASEHERITLLDFARRLAALRGGEAAGAYEPALRPAGHVYFVPSRTLTSGQAASLGLHGPEDLFGGVVPHAFVGTKAISHPLVEPDAPALDGWNPAFITQVRDAVLDGYVAFRREDALEAGRRLLAKGALRIKPVRASGGRGQSVVRDHAGLQAGLAATDGEETLAHGLVLEENLREVRTFSVGQLQVRPDGHLLRLPAPHPQQRRRRSLRGFRPRGGARRLRCPVRALLAGRDPPRGRAGAPL